MCILEGLFLRRLRRRLYPHLHGRVLELGVGTGANLPLYAEGVQLVATDISEEMLAQAQRRPTQAQVQWVQADATSLPFETDSFDFVASSLVFCSVPDPDAALAEIRRVLRPGGWLVLLEHVLVESGPLRWLIKLLAGPWYRKTQSCHLDRQTGLTVARAGLHVAYTTRHTLGVFQIILARNVES